MKKIGTIKGVPVVEGNVNEIKNQILYKEDGGGVSLSKRENGELKQISGGNEGKEEYFELRFNYTGIDDDMYKVFIHMLLSLLPKTGYICHSHYDGVANNYFSAPYYSMVEDIGSLDDSLRFITLNDGYRSVVICLGVRWNTVPTTFDPLLDKVLYDIPELNIKITYRDMCVPQNAKSIEQVLKLFGLEMGGTEDIVKLTMFPSKEAFFEFYNQYLRKK